MNIGIDARPLSYQLTGIGYYLGSLLDALQEVDRTCRYVLISNRPIHYVIRNPNWSKQEGGCRRKLLSTAWMQTAAPLLARRLGLDLFWGPRHHLPLMLPGKIRTVVTIHDVVHLRFPETMSLPHLMVERLLMGRSVRYADRIVAVSHATRADLIRRYPLSSCRVRTVHSGVPPLPPASCSESALPEKYFLFVGTLEPRKNFERMFEAFSRAGAAAHGVHLVITGAAGWKNQPFIRMLERHPLRPFIHFTGYVSRDSLAGLYRRALALVFPSLYEGFGFPILEAMASGAPVITSNMSAMAEVAGDAAMLVDPRDVAQIAHAMVQLISDDGAMRRGLVRKGRLRAADFSWHRAASEMRQIFQEVMPN